MKNDFPSWWEKDGTKKLFRGPEEVPEGWERCNGAYDFERGQWIDFETPAEAPPEPKAMFANEHTFHAPEATTKAPAAPKTRRRKRRK